MTGDFLRITQRFAFEAITLMALDTRMGCFGETMDPQVKEVMHGVETAIIAMGKIMNSLPLFKISPRLDPTYGCTISDLKLVGELS